MTGNSIRRLLGLAALVVSAATPAPTVRIQGGNIAIELDASMHSRVLARFAGREIVLGDFSSSEYLATANGDIRDFRLKQVRRSNVRDALGSGRQWILTGDSENLQKTVTFTTYSKFPRMAFCTVRYRNRGDSEISVTGWTNHHYRIRAPEGGREPKLWSYQSGSYAKRPDWILPLKPGFQQENYLGMNATDYGGGTPLADVWRRDVGLAVGHVEPVPKLVSLPIAMPDETHASLAVAFRTSRVLKPGESLETFRTFVTIHQGDCFRSLRDYSAVMQQLGVRFEPAPESAFQPLWCGWGYGRAFTPRNIREALPVVKKLGFGWVTVDDGWQDFDGDWGLVAEKFPGGDADMQALVEEIHRQGFRAQLWWAPLAAKPNSRLLAEHPDWVLLNADGSKQRISYWNDWYLCPAYPPVIERHRKLVVKFLQQWGYEGLKLDGQHMNGVPPCYNPAHRHARPEEAVEGLPAFFKAIFQAARSIRPDALVEWCPCGTAFNFYTLPYLNMSVASDPRGSWQVRTKAKVLKALHGDAIAYFGDHVELSDERQDFASTLGVGGVVGTNFTWPSGSARSPRLDLTPEKEAVWGKWVALYKRFMLSRGEYLGELYDIGFDRPEAHVIRKSGRLYYAFFAPEWNGPIELRGLGPGVWRIRDYENDRELGTVRGPSGRLPVEFRKHLLLEAVPAGGASH